MLLPMLLERQLRLQISGPIMKGHGRRNNPPEEALSLEYSDAQLRARGETITCNECWARQRQQDHHETCSFWKTIMLKEKIPGKGIITRDFKPPLSPPPTYIQWILVHTPMARNKILVQNLPCPFMTDKKESNSHGKALSPCICKIYKLSSIGKVIIRQ